MKIKKFFFIFFHKIFFPFALLSFLINLNSSKRKFLNYEENNENMSIEERYEYIYRLASRAIFCANKKIKVRGFKNIPKKPVLFVCNHKSNFDVLAFLKAIKENLKINQILPTTFVAKKELESSKKIYYAAKLINSIFIDRNNLRDALRVINDEKDVLNHGEQSVTVFIEGTRIKEDKFGEFKAAALEPAYQTFCSIVPVVIYGTLGLEKENKKSLLKYREITVEFLEPIKYKDFIHLSKENVANKLKEMMEKRYFELKENPNWIEEEE